MDVLFKMRFPNLICVFQMGADERFVEQEEGAIVKECVCFSDESHDGIGFIDFCLDMVLLF